MQHADLARERIHAAVIVEHVVGAGESLCARELRGHDTAHLAGREPAAPARSLDLPRLAAAARTIGGDLALAGNLVWNEEALGWVADWRLGEGGKIYRWQIRGVGFDDAFRNAMAGAAQILKREIDAKAHAQLLSELKAKL